MGGDGDDDVYRVKRIEFEGRRVGVCMQNVNGPCPLLAIANVLSLRGSIEIHADITVATEAHLIDLLTEYLFTTHAADIKRAAHHTHARANAPQHAAHQTAPAYAPPNTTSTTTPAAPPPPPPLRTGDDGDARAESEQQHDEIELRALTLQHALAECVELLPTLRDGADVNVRFDAVDAFEATRVLQCFDLFRIRLLHGWLVDPQLQETHDAVARFGFNQLMDALIIDATEPTENATTATRAHDSHPPLGPLQVELARSFIEDSPSQLTPHGLSRLRADVAGGELAVFFRNNHFATLRGGAHGELFLLLSDLGYAEQSHVVWERVIDCHGNSEFVDARFNAPTENACSAPPPAHAGAADGGAAADDHAFALPGESDLMMAQRLAQIEQEREDARMARAMQDREAARAKSSAANRSSVSHASQRAPAGSSHTAGRATRRGESSRANATAPPVGTAAPPAAKPADGSSCSIQ